MSSKQRRIKRKIALLCALDKASWCMELRILRKYSTTEERERYHKVMHSNAKALGRNVRGKSYYKRARQATVDQRVAHKISISSEENRE